MTTRRTDTDRAASALATASVVGDIEAARRFNVATRTLRSWRKRAAADPQLAAACREKRAEVERGWADDVPGALRQAIGFLKAVAAKATQQLEAGAAIELSPELVHAVAGAFKLLSEAETARRVLDVRLARQAGPTGTQPFQVVAGGKASAG